MNAVPQAELWISVSADVNGAIAGLNALSAKLHGTTSQMRRARLPALALAQANSRKDAADQPKPLINSEAEARAFQRSVSEAIRKALGQAHQREQVVDVISERSQRAAALLIQAKEILE